MVCSLGLVCTTLVSNAAATITTGSQIITWQDRHGGTRDMYVQRVDSDGAVQWTGDSAAVYTAVNDKGYPQLISDRLAGAIIIWQDHRVGNSGIYAQKVDSTGGLSNSTSSLYVVLTSTATFPTNTLPILITATFSQAVTGRAVGNITVGNGTAGSLVAVSGTEYTFDVTPAAQGGLFDRTPHS